MLAKALVRRFELRICAQGIDVKPIVAALVDCQAPSQDTLKLSLELIHVRLGQVGAIGGNQSPTPCPGPIGITHYGVENLLLLG